MQIKKKNLLPRFSQIILAPFLLRSALHFMPTSTYRNSRLRVSVWQVKFPSLFVLTGVVTRGRDGYPQWVKSFKVGYSSECDSWQFFSNSTGHAQVSQHLV